MKKLLALLLSFAGFLAAAEPQCWRVGGITTATRMEYAQFEQHVLTCMLEGDQFTVRTRLQNVSGKDTLLRLPLDQRQIVLRVVNGRENVTCAKLGGAWPLRAQFTIPAGGGVNGEMTFTLPTEWRDQVLVLETGTHGSVKFQLDPAAAYPLPDISRAVGQTTKLDAALAPLNRGNKDVGLRLGHLRCADGLLTLDMAFVNIARYVIHLEGCPRGGDAKLLTEDGFSLGLDNVRGAITERIAPQGSWKPDEAVRGMVSFAMPHRHVARRLWFIFPGYPQLPLVLDDKTGAWRVDEENRPMPRMTQGLLMTQVEDQVYKMVREFWSNVADGVSKRQTDKVRGFFELEKESELFAGRGEVEFDDLRIEPIEEQEMHMVDSEIRMVSLRMVCRLRGQRDSNGFYIPMLARMRLMPDKTWRVKALTFPHDPPFWARGFTHMRSTAHMHVLYKQGDAEHALRMASELEAAYVRLQQVGLPLKAGYAAFYCRDPGDFEILSGADPGMTSGAALGSAIREGGKLRVYNLVLFANAGGLTSHQAFANRGNNEEASAQERRVMLEHELVHLALGEWSRDWVPAWLVEGTAVYFSSEKLNRDDELLRAMSHPAGPRLPDLTRLARLREPQDHAESLHLKYMLSAYAVAVIAKDYGEARLLELYRAFGEEYPPLWQSDDDIPNEFAAKQAARDELARVVLKNKLGISVEELQQTVLSRLRR